VGDGAVLEGDIAAWDGGDAVAGDEDAAEVEGIGGGDGDGRLRGARRVLIAGGAELVDDFREGELLAEGAGDEAAATDFSAGFEAAKDGGEVAPLGGVGFAGEEFAEEDAVTAEEDAGVGVEGDGGVFGGSDGFVRSGSVGFLRTRLRRR